MTCNSLPHAGDLGQRYEVRYRDENEIERIYGWSEQYPYEMVTAIQDHPTWHSPRVIDRKAKP